MDENLKIGDVVCLKSEPEIKLTVIAVLSKDRCEVAFFNKEKQEFQKILGRRNAFQKVNDD